MLHRRTDLTMSAVYATGAMAMVGLICYLITGLELSELVTLLLSASAMDFDAGADDRAASIH